MVGTSRLAWLAVVVLNCAVLEGSECRFPDYERVSGVEVPVEVGTRRPSMTSASFARK
jgi:hypothetical protein